MSSSSVVKLAVCFMLTVLYVIVLHSARSHTVTREYRSYFIDRTTNVWKPAGRSTWQAH